MTDWPRLAGLFVELVVGMVMPGVGLAIIGGVIFGLLRRKDD